LAKEIQEAYYEAIREYNQFIQDKIDQIQSRIDKLEWFVNRYEELYRQYATYYRLSSQSESFPSDPIVESLQESLESTKQPKCVSKKTADRSLNRLLGSLQSNQETSNIETMMRQYAKHSSYINEHEQYVIYQSQKRYYESQLISEAIPGVSIGNFTDAYGLVRPDTIQKNLNKYEKQYVDLMMMIDKRYNEYQDEYILHGSNWNYFHDQIPLLVCIM
jgi:hypothetical protein